jgi:type II secretory pathway pseudopilin PulG
MRRRASGGFTMVEIALSLAVVSFALVAILGVLPTGMTVQKDNREDTIINQEGRYWMQLIRSGARGTDDLTNYVEFIGITNLFNPNRTRTYINDPAKPLTAAEIVGLLSTPKYGPPSNTNRVVARVKAITGPAAEKGSLTNEVSFRYLLESEIIPSQPLPPTFAASLSPGAIAFNEALGGNLYDVRLILRWPVVQRGNDWFVGNNRKTFRARVAGTYVEQTNIVSSIAKTNLFVLAPNNFQINTNFLHGRLLP